MNRMILAVSLIACAAEAAPRHRATMPPQFPPCRTIEGTPAVTFTPDGGATVAPRDAIAFSPADPSVMYFGLEVVEPNGP